MGLKELGGTDRPCWIKRHVAIDPDPIFLFIQRPRPPSSPTHSEPSSQVPRRPRRWQTPPTVVNLCHVRGRQRAGPVSNPTEP